MGTLLWFIHTILSSYIYSSTSSIDFTNVLFKHRILKTVPTISQNQDDFQGFFGIHSNNLLFVKLFIAKDFFGGKS